MPHVLRRPVDHYTTPTRLTLPNPPNNDNDFNDPNDDYPDIPDFTTTANASPAHNPDPPSTTNYKHPGNAHVLHLCENYSQTG